MTFSPERMHSGEKLDLTITVPKLNARHGGSRLGACQREENNAPKLSLRLRVNVQLVGITRVAAM